AGAARNFDDRQGLAELGLDSLQAIDVKSRLSAALGIPLPSTLLFDQPSVQALADYLAGHLAYLFAAPAAAEEERSPGAAPALAELSEQQLFDLLAEQLDVAAPALGGAGE
ncbi:MAG: hypothetical protein RL033_1172, partial [Pseudomonadota bacterium]